MAQLPEPELNDEARASYERIGSVRAQVSGRTEAGGVYAAMFHHPELAVRVGSVGETLRFGGVLPDGVRELAILRCAAARGSAYVITHHLRPARLAGIDTATVDQVIGGEMPADLPEPVWAALEAVDAVLAGGSIPRDVQDAVVAAFGTEGIVELVVLCGHYTTMGYLASAFDIAPLADQDPGP